MFAQQHVRHLSWRPRSRRADLAHILHAHGSGPDVGGWKLSAIILFSDRFIADDAHISRPVDREALHELATGAHVRLLLPQRLRPIKRRCSKSFWTSSPVNLLVLCNDKSIRMRARLSFDPAAGFGTFCKRSHMNRSSAARLSLNACGVLTMELLPNTVRCTSQFRS